MKAAHDRRCFFYLAIFLTVLSSSTYCQAQEADVQWIEMIGGKCSTDNQGRIDSIDLRHCWLSDADLRRVGRMSQLKSVRLAYTKVTDQGLEYLKPLENVEHLDLYYAESIGDAGLAHLKNWRRVRSLDLRGTKVTSTVFDHLIGMGELEELDVGFSRVNDDNFERLSELPKLRRLAIGGNKMSGVAFPLLKLIPSLRELDLGGQQRTDSGLWSVAITDANCEKIAALVQLEKLDVADTNITDRGLSRLSALTNLKSLRLTRTKVTSKGLSAMQQVSGLRVEGPN